MLHGMDCRRLVPLSRKRVLVPGLHRPAVRSSEGKRCAELVVSALWSLRQFANNVLVFRFDAFAHKLGTAAMKQSIRMVKDVWATRKPSAEKSYVSPNQTTQSRAVRETIEENRPYRLVHPISLISPRGFFHVSFIS
jgi:hypothetical protein